MAGKYFDQWSVGETLTHEIRRTVTETDNLLFSAMTHNPQPLHLDAEAARESEFGQIFVNGTFTFSLMIGLSVGDTTLGTLAANLGYDKLMTPKPVFLCDTQLARPFPCRHRASGRLSHPTRTCIRTNPHLCYPASTQSGSLP
jgi:acyl dehydratase